MGDFFVYILKSAACLVVFYLFFRLLLNRDTFHRFNRIAVLCILVLSVIVPFCNIHMDTQIQVNQAVVEFHQLFVEPDNVATVTQSDNSLTWIHGVLIVYLAGIIFFLFRNVYFLLCMRRLLQQGRAEKPDSRVKLVVHDKIISPFSWMNYIIVSENDLRENGKEIMAHEMAHVRKLHSIDILLADICIVFQWFNPAIWLIKQELQNIHEYEADEYVLKEGIDAKHYQLLLIKKAVGKRLYSMANSFNHSKLKKRITMMSKQKSSPWARLKYLYVLPVTVVAITAFARPEISGQLNKIAEVKVSDFSGMAKVSDAAKSNFLVNDTTDVFEFTKTPVKKSEKVEVSKKSSLPAKEDEVFVMTNIPIKESEKESVTKSVSGIVKDSSGNPVVGASVVIVGTKRGTITDMYGKFVLDVPDDATLAISMIDMKSATVKVDKSNYLTITLNSQSSGQNSGVSSIPFEKEGDTTFINWIANKAPLIVIDGKKEPNNALKKLNPNNIKIITILKADEAVKLYGEEGQEGAVIVTTK
ncbi:carboxypeptidase-like regulatory domain-containing protein [Dysgonomonas reticulitermitis]